jgi:hypothetical protein
MVPVGGSSAAHPATGEERFQSLRSPSPSISRATFGYSLGIKHVSVIELFFVASGLLIRLIGGAYAVQIYMSPWIIMATGILALLMAIGKRRCGIAQANDSTHRRKSLAGYNLGFLDAALAALTGGKIVVYLLIFVSEYATNRFGNRAHGESPTDLVLGDSGMLAASSSSQWPSRI